MRTCGTNVNLASIEIPSSFLLSLYRISNWAKVIIIFQIGKCLHYDTNSHTKKKQQQIATFKLIFVYYAVCVFVSAFYNKNSESENYNNKKTRHSDKTNNSTLNYAKQINIYPIKKQNTICHQFVAHSQCFVSFRLKCDMRHIFCVCVCVCAYVNYGIMPRCHFMNVLLFVCLYYF